METVFKYVLSTMGVSKESISKFLIGNRFHVKLRILSPENCKQSWQYVGQTSNKFYKRWSAHCYGKKYYFIWLVSQDTFSAFSYIRSTYMGSSMDVTRTVFTKAMFAW